MIGYVKSIAPEISIVGGGGLTTSWMKRPEWNNPFGGLIDTMVAGVHPPLQFLTGMLLEPLLILP